MTRYAQRLTDPEFKKEILIKSLFVHKDHPFRRSSISPEITFDSDYQSLEKKYLTSYFGTDSLWIIVAANFSRAAGNLSVVEYKKKLEEKISLICQNKGFLPVIPVSKSIETKALPFSKGFSLLAMPGSQPALLFKYQVSLTNASRRTSESLLFVSHTLKKLLRSQPSFMSAIKAIRIHNFYHTHFAIFNLELRLTSDGKQKSIEFFVSHLQSCIDHLLKSTDLPQLYEEARKELEAIYKSRETLESATLVDSLADRIPRFGSRDALIATEVLKKFDEEHITALCRQLADLDNLVVVATGDFPVEKSKVVSKEAALLTSVFPKRSYVHPFDVTYPGALVLNDYSEEAKVPFMLTELDKSKIKVASLNSSVLGSNPYAYDNLFEIQKIDDAQIILLGTNGFQKQTNKFGDRSYCRIQLQTATASKVSALELAQRTLAFREVLASRLKMTQQYLEDYHGLLRVSAQASLVSIEVLAGSQHLATLLGVVQQQADISTMLVAEEDSCKQELMAKALSTPEVTLPAVLSDAATFVTVGFSSISIPTNSHTSSCSSLHDMQIRTKSIYIEGSSSNAKDTFEKFRAKIPQ